MEAKELVWPRHRSQVPSPRIPSDLAEWFAKNVLEAQIPEMGEIRDLEERLFVALKQLGAITYIPTQREREEEPTEEEGAEANGEEADDADLRDE